MKDILHKMKDILHKMKDIYDRIGGGRGVKNARHENNLVNSYV